MIFVEGLEASVFRALFNSYNATGLGLLLHILGKVLPRYANPDAL